MKGAKVSGPISIDNISEEDKIADIFLLRSITSYIYNSVSYMILMICVISVTKSIT